MNNHWKKEFADRFRRHEDELKWLYYGLYHSNEQAYGAFTDMLYRNWAGRPDSLRRIDREREERPAWYRGNELTGMQMSVSAFAGTLQGMRKKLDYLADCGVNCLHLMPLLESPKEKSDGGYAVGDFRKVQPELGTMEDLRALAEDCHARGIVLCLEFVMNHTSEDHEWARRARAGEKEYRDRYYFYDSWEIPNAYEQTVPQACPATAPGNFSWCPEAGKAVMTTFHPYQWDLNYMNPAVFNDMTDNLLNLCNNGADMIRLVAVPYIWKALGTTCRNLPQVHTLVRMMRMACEIVCPGTLLLGETAMEPGEEGVYFGTEEKPECHLLYNSAAMAALWHTVATRDVRLLAHQMRQVFSLPHGYTFLNYLRCRDDIGWRLDYGFLRQFGMEEIPHRRYLNDYLTGKWAGSPARGELYSDDPRRGDARLCGTTASLCGVEAARESGSRTEMTRALRLDAMLHAFVFTLSGVPMICSGDEIAQENDRTYSEDPAKREDSRYLHRGNLDWKKAEKRRKKTTPEGRMFACLREMEEIRRDHAVFSPGADIWLADTGNEHVLCIGRYYLGEQLMAVFNFSDKPETAWLRDGKIYTDLISGKETDAEAVQMEAGSFRWLLHQY